ncbi:hypothetical protein [Streptomyces sp. NBC_01669]|uniref:hypothetical protein n=1 Tax=Streptomyces sp. NBC_01669 TaxID=2975909 RepID=UPI002251FB6B|nr:hypothetical protein [Streptomyces sp. NBC_01669]MCX4531095.1 hypothetical protein [Streptomyces sp. NBC_01669]
MEMLVRRLEAWLYRFFAAVRSASQALPGSDETLRDVVQELVNERALVSAAVRHRPYLPLVDGARACIEHLVETVSSYLSALDAPTPLEAQRHADVAQKRMDASGDVLGMHMEKVNRLNELLEVDSFQDQMAVLLQQSMVELGATDLTELSVLAETEVARILGIPPQYGHGGGLQFALQRALMIAHGDENRFECIVKGSFEKFSRNPELLSSLTVSPHFKSDYEAAILDLFDASSQVTQAVNDGIPRQVGRSLVDIAATLVEGAGQLVAISLLTAAGQKSRPYDKLRQDNATDLLRSARTRPAMEDLLGGFNLDLRTAQAHRMVRYLDDGVHVEIKSGSRSLSWGELIDEIIETCESAMGCLVGLTLALNQLDNMNLVDATNYRSFGISPAVMLSVGMSGMGCQEIFLEEHQDSWTVHLEAPEGSLLTVLVGGISALIPDGVETLTLNAKREDGWHILSGPVSLLRAFLDPVDRDGDNYGLAAARFQRVWAYDGQPCVTAAQVRCWAGRQAIDAISGGMRSVPKLRALRAFAVEVEDPELAESLSAAIRYVRLGDSVEHEVGVVVAKLGTWASTEIEYAPI